MTREAIYALIEAERARQAARWAGPHDWGSGDCSSPRVLPIVKVAVLTEECGEVARAALADYILVFRKPGDNAVPIHPDITNEDWIEWARPIWYNIRESDTLNVRAARADDDDRHICPLQLGTIERCVRLWSNPGEMVLSPFAGIASEGYESVRLGRRFLGCELKREYWQAGVTNLRAVESSVIAQVEMFTHREGDS
jgi:hypothetical protein